jgi:hypothetical protein
LSGYLEMARKVIEAAPLKPSEESLAERRRRKLEEAGRRGLLVRWREYPTWLTLHDPLTGEWHDLLASDCFTSLVEEADRRPKKRMTLTKETKKTKKVEAEGDTSAAGTLPFP